MGQPLHDVVSPKYDRSEDYDETKSVKSTCRSLNIQFKTAQKFTSRDAAKASASLKETKTERLPDNLGPISDKALIGLNVNLPTKKTSRPNMLEVFIVRLKSFLLMSVRMSNKLSND